MIDVKALVVKQLQIDPEKGLVQWILPPESHYSFPKHWCISLARMVIRYSNLALLLLIQV